METREKAEQEFRSGFQKLVTSKALPPSGRPRDRVRGELWDGIYGKKIGDVFFDSRRFRFSIVEQLRECVKSATTMLQRIATVKHLRGDDIEEAALERLRVFADILPQIKDFDRRRDLVISAVRSAVVEAAAALLEGKKVANEK